MSAPEGDVAVRYEAGSALRAHAWFGAHPLPGGGVRFAVHAPHAAAVSVVGEFGKAALARLAGTGAFEGVVGGAQEGALYTYVIEPEGGGAPIEKSDPFAFAHEREPGVRSRVGRVEHAWKDEAWMRSREDQARPGVPLSIYEVHLGSWMRGDDGSVLGYRAIAPRLAAHAREMGFTHVELMPVLEHPYYGSWGYGVTGFFAATARYGTPDDLAFFVDTLHQAGVGVIFDWVPAHFAADAHGLMRFDGAPLFEPIDPARAVHPTWQTGLFDYGRPSVRSFLFSSAMFWVETFHADGLRIDGVEAMLYRDHGRADLDPDAREQNPEGVAFIRELTRTLKREHPDVWLFAEDSSSWPGVTRPVELGGLGFDFKWDLGFSHDMRKYLGKDPLFRASEQGLLTFRSVYAGSESFVIPLSHDDVPKERGGSLLAQMHGDDWQRLANLRLLLASAFAQPGKKLLFMGDEYGTEQAWDHERALDLAVQDRAPHAGIRRMVHDLNRLYRQDPALHEHDETNAGFEWIDGGNAAMSVIVFARKGTAPLDYLVVAQNFTPVPRHQYRIGVPQTGAWREIFNSDARDYGGSGQGNLGEVSAVPYPWNERRASVVVTLPPLGVIFLRPA